MDQRSCLRQCSTAWCGYSLLAGALVGLAGGAANLAVIGVGRASDAAQHPGIAHGLASLIVSAAAGALLLLLVGLLTAPLMATRPGRWLAAAIHGAAVTLLAVLLFTSVFLRAVTGAYVTLGAIEFGLNAERHVLGAALGPFRSWTLSLAAGAVMVLVGAAWLALRRGRASLGPRLSRTALVGAPTALVAAALPPVALEGLSAASPELALLASFDEGAQAPPLPGPAGGPVVHATVAEQGPLLSAADGWRSAVREVAHERPNVLLLTLESVALGHLGYAGYSRETTPNLDRIAARSLRLRRAWTTATHSNYAQMAILSSLFPRRGAGLDVYQRLDYPRVLLHDLFYQLGYTTGTISSQDETWQGMRRFQQTDTPTHYWHSADYTGQHLDTGAELVVPDGVTVDQAASWIGQQRGKPWSLYMNLQVTHFPYRLPPGAPQPFQPTAPIRGDYSYVGWTSVDREVVVNRYDNALAYVDAQVGRLGQFLAQSGQLENTLWIITSDHGELFLEHDLVTHGRSLYDAEARVPLLVHWPRRVRPADAYEPVSHLDILPSLLDLMGLPTHPAFQGRSFVGARAEGDEAPAVFMNIQGLRTADALVCWPWKLIADRTGRRILLFNLEQDPDEHDDRAGKDVRIASEMFRVLRAQVVAQLAYHKPKSRERRQRFAPRLLACPSLPGTRRAEAQPAAALPKPLPEIAPTAPADDKRLAPEGRSN